MAATLPHIVPAAGGRFALTDDEGRALPRYPIFERRREADEALVALWFEARETARIRAAASAFHQHEA